MTPKQRVQREHPKAFCRLLGTRFYVIREMPPPGFEYLMYDLDQAAMSVGRTARNAWKFAAERVARSAQRRPGAQ
jgi:hypothetical protein